MTDKMQGMEEAPRLVRSIFCANCQEHTDHVLSVSQSGEVVATCPVCGRVLKFPAGVTREEFDKLVQQQEESNVGQVTQESIDNTLAALVD